MVSRINTGSVSGLVEASTASQTRIAGTASFHNRGGRLAQQLRVTIGNASENDALAAALAELT